MAEEPSAKRHHGETSNKSSNLVDIHVPGKKHEYTKTLIGVELHGKETLEIICTSIPDKADEVMSRLMMKGGGLYPNFIGVDVEYTDEEEPPQMAVVPQLCVEELCLRKWKDPKTKKYYDSFADVAGGIIHPFYEGMKKKMNRADHKLWGTSPLPDNLITYAGIDAYATYKSWKTIDNIMTGWDISKEQEADPYYHCNFADEDA
ncbi:hypothetical protein VPH35_028125 [Triticum aestivum]